MKNSIDRSKDNHLPTCVASWPSITSSVDDHRTICSCKRKKEGKTSVQSDHNVETFPIGRTITRVPLGNHQSFSIWRRDTGRIINSFPSGAETSGKPSAVTRFTGGTSRRKIKPIIPIPNKYISIYLCTLIHNWVLFYLSDI